MLSSRKYAKIPIASQETDIMENPKLKGVRRVEFRLDAETLELIEQKRQEINAKDKSEALKEIVKQSKTA